MPPSEADRTHHLDDFAELLAALSAQGFDYFVIGGLAVGAYSRLMGRETFSVDLDIMATPETLEQILSWAPRQGMIVRKRPQARTIPVAFIEWNGLEVNVLTSSSGLLDPEYALRAARLFHLSRSGVSVLVADPIDLLRNKLQVNRPKDRPHIEILFRFVEEEAVTRFGGQGTQRERLAPLRDLMKVTGQKRLPESLSERLVELARTPVDFRFLVNHLATGEQAARVAARAPEELREELDELLSVSH